MGGFYIEETQKDGQVKNRSHGYEDPCSSGTGNKLSLKGV